MAESSSSSALRSFIPGVPSLCRWKKRPNNLSIHDHHHLLNTETPHFLRARAQLRWFRCNAKDSSGGEDGFYPWDSSLVDGDSAIEWVPQDRVTLFTSDGIVQIGGSVLPRKIRISSSSSPSSFSSPSHKQARSMASQRFQRQERDYMDPNQGLCLGALFDIAATNGLDTGRRLCIFGFCRSIEMLSDVVEDTVLEHGGEIVAAEKASKGGLQEKLSMTVAVPLLWGVPPASETLHLAVRSGGGIVEKIYWQWDFL